MLTVIMSKEAINSSSEENLRELGKIPDNTRDLTIQADTEATYVVCNEQSLDKPIGFTLRLKHR